MIASPEPQPAGDSPYTISFTEAACVAVILWQGKNIWQMARSGRKQTVQKPKKKK